MDNAIRTDIVWLRERAFHTEKAGDEEILERVAQTLEKFIGIGPPQESDVTKLKTSRDYIEVEQRDLDLEEELRAAYAINGPVVSLIAEFREQVVAEALDRLSPDLERE